MAAAAAPAAPTVPRFGIIGGSGVQVEGVEPWLVKTPFGECRLAALDAEKRVLFASRHHSTSFDMATGKPTYAPPHEVNYRALVWALVVESGCSGIVALGSTGSLHPERIPVGSVVMADDYYMVLPEPVTFWGHEKVGSFADPDSAGVGRIHYTPADTMDERWLAFRRRVQAAVQPVLVGLEGKVRLAQGQTPELWPMVHGTAPGADLATSLVYVNTTGPRFETRAEIRAYRAVGHVVGMTCGREWALCEELHVPYCLVCFCDNACNGLSTHPQGALQEYIENKKAITQITSRVVEAVTAGLCGDAAAA